jgi:hypothetical protein
LLDIAEQEAFDVLVTTDSNLKYQQNLKARRIAIVVLTSTSWPRIQRALVTVSAAIDEATTGSYRSANNSSGAAAAVFVEVNRIPRSEFKSIYFLFADRKITVTSTEADAAHGGQQVSVDEMVFGLLK